MYKNERERPRRSGNPQSIWFFFWMSSNFEFEKVWMWNLINGFGTPLALHRRVTDSPSVTWTNTKSTKLKSLQRHASKKGDVKQHVLTWIGSTPDGRFCNFGGSRTLKRNSEFRDLPKKLLQVSQPYFQGFFIFILEPVVCGWPPVQHPSSQP